jgi:hypothetical protein
MILSGQLLEGLGNIVLTGTAGDTEYFVVILVLHTHGEKNLLLNENRWFVPVS